MSNPIFYILVALTLTSAMISVIFYLAWKTLGEKPHAMSWSLAFLAATFQWAFNLGAPLFPTWEAYWLTVNGLALVMITLGLRGHCQRTHCTVLPENLWPYTGAVFAAIVWTTVVSKHVGISTALVPVAASISCFLTVPMIIRHREKTRPAEFAAAITIGVVGVSQLAAGVIAWLQGPLGDAALRALYVNVNFLTLPAGYTGMAMFVIFMMASDLSEEMKEIAITDQLTGTFNRRGLGENAARAYATARRTARPVSVVMTDIDKFKDINDEFGHSVGDTALIHFADILKERRRADDILARVGGEEFALILPGTVLEDAMRLADELCAKVEASPLQVDGARLPMTASFGVATLSDKDSCLTDIILRADRALYRSKRAGRNRVDLESSQMMLAIDGRLRPVTSG